MHKTEKLFLFVVLCFFALPSWAADHYIYAGSTCASSCGGSWSAAYTGFGTGASQINPAGMVRGDNYWIANGTYGSITFSSPQSGSTVITIYGATKWSHGLGAGWQNSMQGQASFNNVDFSTGYWTVNGQTRGSDWKSGYTIKFQETIGGNSQQAILAGASNLTFKYVEVLGKGTWTSADTYESGILGTPGNFYIGYSYVHDVGDTQFQMNGGSWSGGTWEYNWISDDGMCAACAAPADHFEAYSLVGTNMVIRYNFFENIVSSGIITDASGGGNSVGNWDVYGNVFFWDPGLATRSGWPQLVDLDDGVIALFGNNYSGYFHFYNNTVEGISPNVPQNNNCTLDPISAVSGPNNWNSVTIVVENNLWDNNGANVFGGCQWIDDLNNGGTNPRVIKDHNAYAGGNNGALNADPADTVNVQTSSNTLLTAANPQAIADFQLAANTVAGVGIAAPYNFDLLGAPFGDNGTWERGALQIQSGTTCADGAQTINSVTIPMNWTIGKCQIIASGKLDESWNVVVRHGEYGQSETECNIPQKISQSAGLITLTASIASYTCNDYNPSTGASDPNNPPQSWPDQAPYIQWANFAISPSTTCSGKCVITIQTSMPLKSTGAWPSFWMLGTNCQTANKYTGDPDGTICPFLGSSGYQEWDLIECIQSLSPYCQSNLFNPGQAPAACNPSIFLSDSNVHTYVFSWTSAGNLSGTIDGTQIYTSTCTQSNVTAPMYLMYLIQAGGTGGTLHSTAVSTASLVEVQDISGNIIYYDDFGATSAQVATPTFSPAGGTYSTPQTVTISTSTGGATICYTTDGSTPTGNGAGSCTHGTTYSGPVAVSISETLEAIGTESGFTDSSVGSAAYTIGLQPPTNLSATPE